MGDGSTPTFGNLRSSVAQLGERLTGDQRVTSLKLTKVTVVSLSKTL